MRPDQQTAISSGEASPTVLLVDDEPELAETLASLLETEGFSVLIASRAEVAQRKLHEAATVDAALIDLRLSADSEEGGLALTRWIHGRYPDLPVVMMTGFGTFESAVEALRAGAYDYITKPIDHGPLVHTLRRAIRVHRLEREVRALRDMARPFEGGRYGQMVGNSSSIRRMFDLLHRIEDSDAAVLVLGESGTGKELVARALHHRSPRGGGPFVAVNTAALPETLLESTLFGHRKGAFTGANEKREGLFLAADGGTLFLDEIGEMPLEMQAKLLRVLQERKVRPVGGTREVPFDIRLVCATNRDLEEEVEAGRFREDLFYRVNVVSVRVPALRARGNDVVLLAQHFLNTIRERTGKQVDGIDAAAARKFVEYDWPGNVRELENVIERAVAITRSDTVTLEDLPRKLVQFEPRTTTLPSEEDVELMAPLAEVERRYIERVLEAAGKNKTLAAKVLGLDRRTLYRKMERWSAEARRDNDPDPDSPSDNAHVA
ncbi:MAG: sigma-54 dependent transcriptional regulator [Myxococcota bacterium]